MATLAEFRQQYPMYSDVNDADLANALHQKYYSDIPKQDFDAQLGLTPSKEVHGDNWKDAKGDKLMAYEPTWRDKLATAIMPDERASPQMHQFVSGLLGTTGMGKTGSINAIDFTPARIPLLAQESVQHFQNGDFIQGAADAVGALPVPVLNRALEGSYNAVRSLAPTVDQAAVQAAHTIGVELPVAAALDNSMASRVARETTGGLSNLPVVGTAVRARSEQAIDGIEQAATAVRQAYSPGQTAESAGQTARDRLRNWVTDRSGQVADRLYGAVDQHIPPGTQSQLTNTRAMAQELLAQDAASATRVNDPAINHVLQAVTEPNGLSFEGLRRLRTTVGDRITDAMRSETVIGPAYERLYGALSADLEAAARAAGPQAERAFQRANGMYRLIQERRQTIEAVIGKDAAKTPESIVGRLIEMAGSANNADVQGLLTVRRALGNDWDHVSSVAVDRLGMGNDGVWNLTIFGNKYGKLSDNGRNILFSSTQNGQQLRPALDAFQTLSQRFKDLQRYSNHSRTGTTNVLAAGAGAIGTSLVTGNPAPFVAALASVVPAAVLMRMMAQPAQVQAINRFGLAAYNAAVGRGGDAAIKLAAGMLARQIADETGEDERPIAHRLITHVMGLGGEQ